MASKLLFLSHVHEEKDLALLLKEALESEFSGFVDVFVSSDGVSIPPGSNFLRKIEDGLVCCVGAIYLISPLSTRRHWVSFELGAVWIRNALNGVNGGPQIPALPICHSGMTPSEMPAPLNHLNGIVASDPRSLEAAFRSLQSAVGGRGPFRTDFQKLAIEVAETEKRYATELAIFAAPSHPRTPPIGPSREAIRVAIVDDHQIVRSGMTQYLSESSDLEVVGTAADGAEAIELVTRRKIDVLTLDLSMPVMGGIEALPRIKKASPRTQVIILSGYPPEQYADQLIKAGAFDYLNKEVEPVDILHTIRRAARSD